MPAAWAAGISAVAGVAGSMASGSAQASGAKKAAKQQAIANQKAIDLQRQTYDQQRAALAQSLAEQRDIYGSGTEEQKNALAQSYERQQAVAEEAYRQQVAAAERAWALQQQFQDPWFQVGKRSINKLENRPDFAFTAEDFNKHLDPGYAFRLKEGQQALDRTASARGGLLSGGALKAATQYGQEMGSQEFMNAYNRALQTDTTNYNRLANLSQWGQHSADMLTGAAGDYGNNLAAYAGMRGGNLANYAGQYGSNLSTVLGNRAGQLGSAVGNYGTNLANLAGAYGKNVGDLYTQGGQNQANSLLAQANAQANMYAGMGSAVGQAAGAYGNYKMNQAGLDAYNRRTDAMATGGYGTGLDQRAGAFSTPSSSSTPAYRGRYP